MSDKSEPQMKAVKVSFRPSSSSCNHCGFPHGGSQCKCKDLTCHKCKNGHLKRMCPSVPSRISEKRSSPKEMMVKIVTDTEPGEQASTEEEHLLYLKGFVCHLKLD